MTSDAVPTSPPSGPASSFTGPGIGSATSRSVGPATSAGNAPLDQARRELQAARGVGLALTMVYLGFFSLSALTGANGLAVALLVIAALFAYGTALAFDSPGSAKAALVVGMILSAPLGLIMTFLYRRIDAYHDALFRARRTWPPVSGGGPQGPAAP